jgi:XTP/dITP diphosphohydrolase
MSSINCWIWRLPALRACMPPSSAPVPRPLIVATHNPGKLRELRALLAELPYTISGLGDLGVASPEESGATFLENVLLKARHAAAAAGNIPAIADDSGLEVDALGGAPGIFSARYAGPGASDADNNVKLVGALAGVPWAQRAARYRCALVFVREADDSAPLIAEGVWHGVILDTPQGVGGFGYDPYFWLPDRGMTAAQLDLADKNRLSHRGIAMRTLCNQLTARERALTAAAVRS